MPETEPLRAPRPFRSIVLLVIYATLAGCLFCLQATSWPHQGSWALLGYVVLVPGILFQASSLVYARIAGRPITRPFLARLVTVPLGLIIAALLQEGASSLALENFKRAYAPFVAQIGANPADACASGAKLFAIPMVAAFNERTGSRPTALLYQDGKRYVLGFRAGSIDIDGGTLYYESSAKEWRRYHNDNEEARAAHDKLVAGLASCKLRAG
jgi:hypothetical protein